jgi:hypothetical protein
VTENPSPKYIGETEKNLARLHNGELDEWITTAEAVQISGYHVEYIRQLAREGKFVAKKWTSDWMIDSESLLEYLQRIDAQGARRGPKPR